MIEDLYGIKVRRNTLKKYNGIENFCKYYKFLYKPNWNIRSQINVIEKAIECNKKHGYLNTRVLKEFGISDGDLNSVGGVKALSKSMDI